MNHRKVAIIGCGFVGASIAFSLIQKGLFSEMVLIDANHDKAEGEAMDLSHGLPYLSPMEIYAGTYEDVSDCALVIITAGANQKPGETRLDLIDKNVGILKTIIPQITARPFEGMLMIVSNPVDVLTRIAQRHADLPESRVFGSGTVLDTARLRYLLGEHLRVDNRSVHAFIVGEHGDGEIALWSSATVSGVPLRDFCEMRGYFDHENAMREIGESVKNSAYRIIERKGATYYGIAMAILRICEAVVRDERSVLPVSTALHGEFGIADVALSVPAIVGRAGVEKVVPVALDADEHTRLQYSADVLRGICDGL